MCAILLVLMMLVSGCAVASWPEGLGAVVVGKGRVLRVASPELPLEVGQPVPEAIFGGGSGLQIGDYRYTLTHTECTGTGRLQVCNGGVTILNQSGTEVAFHATPESPSAMAWLGDYFYITWQEADILDAYCGIPGGGLQVLDVSDPVYPVLVGDYPLPGWSTDLQVNQALAHVLTTCGLHIFDLSQPDILHQIGSLSWDIEVPTGSLLDGTMLYVIRLKFAYGELPTLIAIDLSDPTNPVDVGWRLTLPERTGSTVGQRMAVIDGVLLVPIGDFVWHGYRLP